MKPFDAIAALVVSFRSRAASARPAIGQRTQFRRARRSQGVPYEVRLALPTVFTKFLEPVALSPNVFVQRWATLGAPGLEHMATFAASEAATAAVRFAARKQWCPSARAEGT